MTTSSTPSYKDFRFPQEVIAHTVRLYFRFPLSYRDVEELLFAWGVVVTYETVRQLCRKLGQGYAKQRTLTLLQWPDSESFHDAIHSRGWRNAGRSRARGR